MALNIGTNAQFATSAMKPENGEQIDSLWGQNIADNTGYVAFSPQHPITFAFSHTPNAIATGTMRFWLYKQPTLQTFKGTLFVSGSNGGGAGRGANGSLFISGNFVVGTNLPLPVSTAGEAARAFSYDLSSLTDNAYHEMRFVYTGSNVGANDALYSFSLLGYFCP